MECFGTYDPIDDMCINCIEGQACIDATDELDDDEWVEKECWPYWDESEDEE